MTDPTTPEAKAINVVREGLLDLSEVYATAIEVTVGYRTRLLAEGFSETAAEVMAMDFHRVFIAGAFGGAS